MDCPINCTIKNCVAIGCGKRASKESDVRASGFGIGTGYSNEETIFISNCTSIGNKKYGYFFEHQGRFDNKLYSATRAESFVVSNCIASGNMYDFGGARSNDVTYENCTSNPSDTTKKVFYFEERSRRNYLINCETNQEFDDVKDTSQYYYAPVYWALNKGITDVEDGATYENAVNWALNKGIITGTTSGTFLPYNSCTRADIVTFLYCYANTTNEFSIRYNLDGGELETANPATYKAGTSEFTLNNPTKKGYTFEGWTGSSYSQTGYVGENKYIPIKTVKMW